MAGSTILEKVGDQCRRVVRRRAEKLGLDNRMALAKSYNRWRNRGLIEIRRNLLRDPAHLEYTAGIEAFALRNGWCVPGDALSFAGHPIISDAEAILAENRQPGSRKGFMVNHLTHKDLGTYPSFIEAALHPRVLKTATNYLGMYPILSSVKLLVSMPGSYDRFTASQLYHLDHSDRPLLKLIINVNEVTVESGPLCFLPASTSKTAKQALGCGKFGKAYLIEDETMYGVADRRSMVQLTGAPGDTALVDTSQCFHHGSRNASRERHIVMYSFSTPARSDFRKPTDYSVDFACHNVLQRALLDPYFRYL